jgi:hypothetical protein
MKRCLTSLKLTLWKEKHETIRAQILIVSKVSKGGKHLSIAITGTNPSKTK